MIHGHISRVLQRLRRARATQFAAALLSCGMWAFTMVPATAKAQDEAEENHQTGFSVQKESKAVADALADFERYRDKNQWDKAFAALGKSFDAPQGLVPDKDGLFIQAALKVRAELLSLPPAGREAYRLFNDPKAELLLKDALDSASDSSVKGAAARMQVDEVAALRRIVDRYFITSAGDKAADLLGDALFEAGEFDGAERSWGMIIESYPDTGLSLPLLQTKRGIALARAGQWEKFATVRALVHERFAGKAVRIGGKDVDAAQCLDELDRARPTTTRSTAAVAALKPSTMLEGESADPPTSLPASDAPAWQIPLMDQATRDRIGQQLGQMGWGGYATLFTDVLPCTAVDDKRVYANWMGSCFAADLATGKMLWRTNPFFDFGQNVQQMVMQGEMINMSEGAVVIVGDRVLVTKGSQPNPRVQQNNLTRLSCMAADTGKSIWTSEREGAGTLSEWSFVGKPLVSGDVIYLCAFTERTPAINLMCIGLAKGELRWRAELGNEANRADFRGNAMHPSPALMEHDGKVYVLTNSGALLAVNISSHEVDWAFSNGSHVDAGQQQFNPNMMRAEPAPSGAMLLTGSTLYFKETGGEMLYAMDLAMPSLRWKRPVDASVGLAAADDRNLFLVGSEVDCINIDSRAMLWSDGLSLQSGDILPLSIANRLYVFDSHGVHEVQTDTGEIGAVFRGCDRDASGGKLSRTADRLITISSWAITAYPLNRSASP